MAFSSFIINAEIWKPTWAIRFFRFLTMDLRTDAMIKTEKPISEKFDVLWVYRRTDKASIKPPASCHVF